MKINFLTSKFSGATGGVIYDEILYDKLRTSFGNAVNLIQDENFLDEDVEETINYKRYGKVYRDHVAELVDCDYLIINSRLYTRFKDFPWHKVHAKCKIVLIHHHFNYMTQTKCIAYMAHKYLELSFLRRANVIITPNRYTLDVLRHHNFENKTRLIEAYIPNNLNQPLKKKKKQILFMGTIEPRKGINYGIDAFNIFQKNHPDYTYVIAGTFDEKSAFCKDLINQVHQYHLEEKVKFLGRVSEKVRIKLFEESCVFLFPSQNEGYGLVIVEAMSYGMPVIVFNNTAMPYTVNETNGVVVRNKDIHAMANALEGIISNGSEYQKLSNGASKTVLQLPSKTEIDKEYDALILQIKEYKL